ncbi:MAG: hypothetical protein QNK82_04920 [Akkermansiaceae bacterium]
MPSYDVLHNLINGVAPHDLAEALKQSPALHQDKLPKSLALDWMRRKNSGSTWSNHPGTLESAKSQPTGNGTPPIGEKTGP